MAETINMSEYNIKSVFEKLGIWKLDVLNSLFTKPLFNPIVFFFNFLRKIRNQLDCNHQNSWNYIIVTKFTTNQLLCSMTFKLLEH